MNATISATTHFRGNMDQRGGGRSEKKRSGPGEVNCNEDLDEVHYPRTPGKVHAKTNRETLQTKANLGGRGSWTEISQRIYVNHSWPPTRRDY